ncbi:MAG: hypothetical protein ACREHV_08390 [Rhizomicrobium sp.]
MRHIAKGLTARGHGRRTRRWITWVLLLAFTLQSFVTQIHLHGVAPFGDGAAIAKVLAKTPVHRNAPADNDPATCPFCQAIIHAGAFFTPAPPILIFPAQLAQITASLPVRAMFCRAVSHGWKSRAPPQH